MAKVIKGEVAEVIHEWNELEKQAIFDELHKNIKMAYVFDDYDLAYLIQNLIRFDITNPMNIKEAVESECDYMVTYKTTKLKMFSHEDGYMAVFEPEDVTITMTPNWML